MKNIGTMKEDRATGEGMTKKMDPATQRVKIRPTQLIGRGVPVWHYPSVLHLACNQCFQFHRHTLRQRVGGVAPAQVAAAPPRRSLRHAALGNTVDQPEPVEQEQEPAAPIPENQPLSLEALNILSTVAAAAQAITAPPDYATNIFLKASQILDRLLAGVNTQEKDFDLLPSGVSLSDLGARIQAKEVLEVTSDFSAMLALLRWRLKLEWCVLFLILDFFLKMFPNAAVYERAGVVLTMSLRQK
jgi:hypothetical protein